MKKEMRRWVCFDEWQTDKMEAWLSAWAEKGWHLKKMGLFFALFRRGKPAHVRYRCDMSANSTLSVEQRNMIYKSAGWDHVPSNARISVYCAEDANAPEIHTDPWEHAEIYRKLRKNYSWNLITNLFLVACYAPMLLVDSARFNIGVLTGGELLLLCVFFGFVYLAYRSIKSLIMISSTTKRIASGVPSLYDRLYKATLISKRILWSSCIVIFAVFLSASVYDIVNSFSENTHLPIPAGELTTIRMSDVPTMSQFKPDGDSELNYYRIQRSMLVPEQVYLENFGTLAGAAPDDANVDIISERYRALTPGLARLLAGNLAKMSYVVDNGGWGRAALPYIKDNGKGFDALWYYDNLGDDRHEVVAQKGLIVYHVILSGPVGCDAIIALLRGRAEGQQ